MTTFANFHEITIINIVFSACIDAINFSKLNTKGKSLTLSDDNTQADTRKLILISIGDEQSLSD